MEMHQLRYFVAVAREGNFTRAARACHVSQPSLSQQIRKLEEELGQSLLHRLKSGKSVLSPAGELFFPRAVRILQEAKLAASELDHINENVSGIVRLGAIPTLAPYLVPDSVLRFNRDYPAVELVAHETTTSELLAMLWRNELDFALASPPFAGGPWEMQPLGSEPLLLATPGDLPQDPETGNATDAPATAGKRKATSKTAVKSTPQGAAVTTRSTAKKSSRKAAHTSSERAQPLAANTGIDSIATGNSGNHTSADSGSDTSAAHAPLAFANIKHLTLNDLADESFILMREGHCLSNQVVGFCQQADFKPKVRFLSAQVETLKALIRAGAGISLLPSLAIDPADKSLRYFRLHDKPSPQREIVALWRSEFPLSRAASEFIRYARQTLQKRLGE